MTYRSGPRSLAEAFGSLNEDLAPATLLAEVQRAWPAAVGDAIARQARPTGDRAGVVTVTCDDAMWANDLDLMAPQILAKLNAALRGGEVRKLRCVSADRGR